jgi:hypothetical protein
MRALGLVQAEYISFAHIIECDSNISGKKEDKFLMIDGTTGSFWLSS